MQGRRDAWWIVAVVAALAVPRGVGPVLADPVPGFVENWSGTTPNGWGGGNLYSNPGTGGTGGAGDGFLLVSNVGITQQKLGTFSVGAEYLGDWVAAGVSAVKVWLKDVGAAQSLQIHFSIGSASNFWQYDQAFVPLTNQWTQFVVDLSGPTGWTQIIGSGTFEDALRTVDKVHIRHDLPPFMQHPDELSGDFGIDQLLITDEIVPVLPTTWGRIKSIYR